MSGVKQGSRQITRGVCVILTFFLLSTAATSRAQSHVRRLYTKTVNTWTGKSTPLRLAEYDVPYFPGVHPEFPRVDIVNAKRVDSFQDALSDDERVKQQSAVSIAAVARGMRSPDGLAIHPINRDVFVSEETAGRILRVDGRQLVPIVDSDTPVYHLQKKKRKRIKPLRSPEGIAFSKRGDLYAVEDLPGGRLLRFPRQVDGTYTFGLQVSIPGEWKQFAWESVQVGAKGEILLAGSSVESVGAENAPLLFGGAILYRDAHRTWWLVHHDPFGSFSSACFSPDGKWAAFTCELTGAVGWVGLEDRLLRMGTSPSLTRSPEGICLLPNGFIVVAEEGGDVKLLDPKTGRDGVLAHGLGSLESVMWDNDRQRILVTKDGEGQILALIPRRPMAEHYENLRLPEVPLARTPLHIPEECPGYLTKVMARGGIDFEGKDPPPMSFRKLASRVPMVAIDSLVEPVKTKWLGDDPIERIQCVVFMPGRAGMTEKGLIVPFGAFIAQHKSGKVIHTKLKSGVSARMYEDAAVVKQVDGLASVCIPYPASVTVSEEGATSVQFLGMSEVPDFLVVVDPHAPENNQMIVQEGEIHRQYNLVADFRVKGDADNIVLSHSRELGEEWHELGKIN